MGTNKCLYELPDTSFISKEVSQYIIKIKKDNITATRMNLFDDEDDSMMMTSKQY